MEAQNTEFEVITDSTPDPHYPTYCDIFLSKAGELDEIASRMVMHAIKHIEPTTPAGEIVAQMFGALTLNTVANKGHNFKSKALHTAHDLPLPMMKDYFAGKIDNLTMAFADKKVGLLAPIVGPGLVGAFLPKALRTPEAAAYMHRARHYALNAVIEHALDCVEPQ